MKRRTIGEVIFWGAAALAMTLYGMSMPNGLPWNPPASESHLWHYLVAMAGGSATGSDVLGAPTSYETLENGVLPRFPL